MDDGTGCFTAVLVRCKWTLVGVWTTLAALQLCCNRAVQEVLLWLWDGEWGMDISINQ